MYIYKWRFHNSGKMCYICKDMNNPYKTDYTRAEIIEMLSSEGEKMDMLFSRAADIKHNVVGDKLYLRGLIEYSNICRKNCLYCGIRRGNDMIGRYRLSEEEVMSSVQYAVDNRFGSIVIQAGEDISKEHVDKIEHIVRKIADYTQGELGITLSFGEQSEETYLKWFEAGAHRYLLRIEASSPKLYSTIHPRDSIHDYTERLNALKTLRKVGYQVGSGVMIGLPGQTVENLADDILFMRDLDIDMCGMGPYIEAENTPMLLNIDKNSLLYPVDKRLEMSLKMVAVLRIVMPDINIASTTALSSLSDDGRYLAVRYGANVIMPNITPLYRLKNYALYDNKSADEDPKLKRMEIAYGERGDSLHFRRN